MSSIADKLKQLNIKLPEAPSPVGAYVAYKKVKNLLFISGQLPIGSDGKIIKGNTKNGAKINHEINVFSFVCEMLTF